MTKEEKIYQTERSIKALSEIIPPQIPFSLLDFQLGEKWIPIEFYKNFGEWLFNTRLKLVYFESVDTYNVEVIGNWTPAISREYYIRSSGRTTLHGHDLYEHALQNTAPYFTYTTNTGEKLPDNDAIQLANEKIETIRHKFVEWLGGLDEDSKQQLVDLYNNKYNCYVLRKYNGSHLTFPGLNLENLGIKGLYDSQINGVWRILQDNGAIIDHEVGSGKSALLICASYEMKRMGIRKKPCILALKANINQIVDTYRKAYPHAKILAPSEQDFDKKNRPRLFHEIKNNDWDCVIMTHDQFGKIPQSPEIQKEILQEEMDNLQRDLDALGSAGYQISRTMKKGLEGRKAGLDVKLKEIKGKIEDKQDLDINFDEMGIDHLFIDEAHKYKNLTYTTRHDRVAGLGNTTGSQKALNMLFAIRTLQKRFDSDMQATFLSGTPISNSLTEMYLLFKYLRPRELARQNILNFDSWAAVFAKKTTDFEFSVTNQIIAKERFRHFIKVPELTLFYNEIADYRTNKSINIDKPDMVEELVPLKPTEDQQEFIKNLILFAKTGDGTLIGREPLTPSENAARMLIATNYAKKMSCDMRLIDEELYEDHPDNKVNSCARKIYEFYEKFNEQKGTQIVFCDLGTPKPDKFNIYDAMKDKLVEDFGIPESEVTFIHDWEEKTKYKLFQKMNNGEIRVLIGSTDKAGTGLNVQERIVAMHHLDIPWKPAELEQRNGRGARQGNWLAKLHQDNKVYNYIYATEQSLDNYKFTLLKNKQLFISQMKNNELQVRSIDEGSFDEQSGMNFAEYIAVLSGDSSLLEKAKIDKKLAVLENLRNAHYREISTNKYALAHKISRLEEVEEIVPLLERDNEQYNRLLTKDDTGTKENPVEIFALKEVLEDAAKQRQEIKEQKEAIKKARKEAREKEKAAKNSPDIDTDESEEDIDEIVIPGVPIDKVKDNAVIIGDYLIEFQLLWRPKVGESTEILGTLYGFNVCIQRENNYDESGLSKSFSGSNGERYLNKYYAQHPDGGIKYTFSHGMVNRDNSRIAARNFLNAIDKVSSICKNYQEEKAILLTDIRNLKAVQESKFRREDEITELQETSKRLEKEIREKITGAKSEPSKQPEKQTAF